MNVMYRPSGESCAPAISGSPKMFARSMIGGRSARAGIAKMPRTNASARTRFESRLMVGSPFVEEMGEKIQPTMKAHPGAGVEVLYCAALVNMTGGSGRLLESSRPHVARAVLGGDRWIQRSS